MTRCGFEMRVGIPATWDAVERILTQVRERAPEFTKRFGNELLLREALNNAVPHGWENFTCRVSANSS